MTSTLTPDEQVALDGLLSIAPEGRWVKLGRLVEALVSDEGVGPSFLNVVVNRIERRRGDDGFEYLEFSAGNLSPERYDRLRAICDGLGAKLHVLSKDDTETKGANVRVWP